jgi:hypothetical protein
MKRGDNKASIAGKQKEGASISPNLLARRFKKTTCRALPQTRVESPRFYFLFTL